MKKSETDIVVTRGGDQFVIPKGDTRLRMLLSGKCYGATYMTVLKKILPSPNLVVDVGAHCGMSSLQFSRWAKAVIAYEPHPDLYDMTRVNLQQANLNNVNLKNAAVGSSVGNVSITTSLSASLGNHVASGRNKTKTEVDVVSLDSDIADRMDKIDFIKADVEGYEFEVIKGALGILRKRTPVLHLEMVPEFLRRYGSTVEELQSTLVELGYKVYSDKGGGIT